MNNINHIITKYLTIGKDYSESSDLLEKEISELLKQVNDTLDDIGFHLDVDRDRFRADYNQQYPLIYSENYISARNQEIFIHVVSPTDDNPSVFLVRWQIGKKWQIDKRRAIINLTQTPVQIAEMVAKLLTEPELYMNVYLDTGQLIQEDTGQLIQEESF